jgi:hypothetical protein
VKDVVSAQRCGAGGGGAAGRKGRLCGRESEEQEGDGGVEDSKEVTTERIEEQRALYTRTKRRGSALPDRGVAN